MKHTVHHIKKDLKSHAFNYLILITAGIFFLTMLNLYKGERLMEFILLLIFASFYIIWGIYQHIVDDTLHLKIVIEYILIAFTMIFLLKILIIP
ncbi:MAG: hypothetical protein US11_C0002G0055 [Candidatus Roizmanbacteria bacterium GW2011_GWA2_36_23]|uniref:Uncharacterized protein n=1 Tax=Candidatus Roizmanbacteria bacterium GW2011_GWA2_36_23 TaxID=1618480 RepID=A0A0G0HDH3_9BACT|nr:MAG: hypothetical protein US11_C0002G0055 [Candidatus Roizmanbacteria bacterium GW2011_GWA2_36_23]